jgi:hypothetical protein
MTASAPICRKCVIPYERFEPSSDDIREYKASGAVPASLIPNFHSLLLSDPDRSVTLMNAFLVNPLVEHLRIFTDFKEDGTNANKGVISIFCDHEYAVFIYFEAFELVNIMCYQKLHSIDCPRCLPMPGNPGTLVVDSFSVPECDFILQTGMTSAVCDHFLRRNRPARSSALETAKAVFQFWWKECIYTENRFAAQI